MNQLRVFDGHCDTALALYEKREGLRDNSGHVSLRRAEALDGYAQFFAFFTTRGPVDPETYFGRLYQNFQKQLTANAETVSLCRQAEQVEAALDQGKLAALLSIEGAEAIGCDPGKLEWAKELGIRMIGLTWNDENALACSHLTGGGLTAQGREFVKRAQKLGLVIDVSHCSERTFWDVCDIAERPIAASHSNARVVWDHSRNLTDEQYRALCDLGGTAGLNFYTAFLGPEPVNLDAAVRHLEHFAALGEGHVALGGDWDGCDSLPAGISGIDGCRTLKECLLERGWTREQTDRVFYGNLMGVLKQCDM